MQVEEWSLGVGKGNARPASSRQHRVGRFEPPAHSNPSQSDVSRRAWAQMTVAPASRPPGNSIAGPDPDRDRGARRPIGPQRVAAGRRRPPKTEPCSRRECGHSLGMVCCRRLG